ncbi:MAG: hypothetical protein E7632_11710 [Ruminococcaceae bacterium]|nr:hypothetical protein [Oscillospiraceae bacterium]
MSKFDNIMIVTDLDGTFFNSNRQLVQKNLDAVAYFKENGGLFAIASGREPVTLGIIAPIAPTLLNTPCPLANGAFLYDFSTCERLDPVELDYDKTTQLLAEVRDKFPTTSIRISTPQGYHIPYEGEYIKKILAPFRENLLVQNAYHVSTLEEIPHCGWFRVSFDGSPEELAGIAALIEPKYGDYFAFNLAEAEIYEFQAPTATKGQAVDRLRRRLIENGQADESLRVYAVGDYGNDLDLLRHADVACCPANAIDEVKDIASVHLCDCDDGCTADLISRIERGEA